MKALLYTSDPYEPSGVIGLYETEEQKQEIIKGYKEYLKIEYSYLTETQIDTDVAVLKEIEIPVGIFGQYY